MSDDKLRERFEALIASSPYERPITRWDFSEKRAWPGQYKHNDVQIAWEFYQTAAEETARECAAKADYYRIHSGVARNIIAEIKAAFPTAFKG